ncbi:MAG: sensor domain-containing diguanylate cyclase [Lachnospiraceae bacterium]|nr:sensor domain-containing diguanylate cyclase [Lachnospiraceae bacterium]
MEKKARSSIYKTIPAMAIVPLMLFGLLVLIICSWRFNGVMHEKVEDELQNIAASVAATYDTVYPGEYRYEAVNNIAYYYKGDEEITGDFTIIDSLKDATGAEITIFYKDVRMLTTIKDDEGKRFIGSGVSTVICQDVLDLKTAKFYDGVVIGDYTYCAYYMPLLTENGGCIGMIAVAKPSEVIKDLVFKAVIPIAFVIVAAMLVAGFISFRYAKNLATAIGNLQKALANVAKGELSKEPHYTVMGRNDEISDMGKSVVSMQKSLHVLIERDALTELYNRRCANQRLKKMMKKAEDTGTKFCIAIGDIDFFKKVNDTYGHEVGDKVLVAVAKAMKATMTGKGFVARWGGEEFLLVYDETEYKEGLAKLKAVLDNVRKLEIPDERFEMPIKVTMTFGITAGGAEDDMDQLLRIADERLYSGKSGGRNQIVGE